MHSTKETGRCACACAYLVRSSQYESHCSKADPLQTASHSPPMPLMCSVQPSASPAPPSPRGLCRGPMSRSWGEETAFSLRQSQVGGPSL